MSALFDLSTTVLQYQHEDDVMCAHSGGAAVSDYPGGEGSVTTGQIDLEKDAEKTVLLVGANIFDFDGDDSEAYPAHDTLVAVLYIGVKDAGQKTSVSFDGNGGTASSGDRELEVGDPIGTLPMAEKDGCVFTGWSTQPDGGQQVFEDTIITKQTTIYAQYIQQVVTL